MLNISFGGTNPRTGEYFVYYETQAGGYGGRLGLDGMDGVDGPELPQSDVASPAPEAAAAAEARARDDADRRDWQFAKLAGELLLIRRLIDGAWDPADFLVLQAGERLAMSYDEGVIRAEPVSPVG